MRKKLLILLAAFALLALACDASSLVKQFLPEKELADAQATLEAVAPTVAAVATQGVPTKLPAIAQPTTAPGATQPAATKAAAQPTSGSSASAGNLFDAALGKARSATKYRVQFTWIFGGMEKGKYAETPFIDFTGEIDNGKSHMTSKGGLLAMLAKDANTPIEIVEADSKTYMKGVSMFGMTDPKIWYITDNDATSGFGDFAAPDEYKDWVSGAKSGDIKKVRTEQFDNQNCDVYLYDMKTTQNAALIGLLGSSKDQSDFSAVDKGEMSFWLCNDGFVHKFLLDYEGHDAKDATQKGAMKMSWHAWDFNNATIAVTAPKDAKPMPK